ncbi:hypothetical protein Tco_1134624 [Tanacetum coccineum]
MSSSNERLRQSRVRILWGMFHNKNVDFAELTWEDFQYQIEFRQSKLRRREIMPYPRFTKIIINYFLSQHKSLAKKKHSHINTIKDDGVLYRLKFVRISEDVQEYGRAIPDTMLTDEIKKSKDYKAFIGYSTRLVPPKKTRSKGSKGKKEVVTPKNKSSIYADDNIIPEPDVALEPTGKRRTSGVVFRDTSQVSKKKSLDQSQKLKGAGITPEVLDESAGILTTSSEGIGITLGVPNEVKGSFEAKVDSTIDWGSENESDYFEEAKVDEEEIEWLSTDEEEEKQDDDDDDTTIDLEKTYDEDEYAEYTTRDDEYVHEDEYMHDGADEEMKDVEDDETKKDDAAKAIAEKTEEATAPVSVKPKEMSELPPTSSSLSISSSFALTTKTPVSTILSHSPVQQQTTPNLTPPITSTTQPLTSPLPATKTLDAPVPPSKALTAVLQRVSTLEKDFKELKKVYHSAVIFESIRSQVPPTVNDSLGSSLGDSLQKIKQEHASKQKWSKHSTTPFDKIMENKYKQKDILFKMMMASKSYEKHPAHKELYNALIQSLFLDQDDMDQAATAMGQSALLKRKHDDQNEDPIESSKGSAPHKTSKSGKSVTAEEPDEEHVHDMSLDVEENIVNEMVMLMNNLMDQLTFDELMATPIDFYKFVKNRLKLEKITKADLVGPVYNLLKGTCQRSIELEYNMEECYKDLTGKTLKTKVARFSKHDVYSPLKILSVVSVNVNKLHGYGYLEEIVVRRADRQLYKFKECDFVNLHLNYIEDMLLFVVQHKLFHLDGEVIVDLAVALHIFTRSLIINKRVKDVQLGVESYQKNLNVT